ncbi:MAG: hypothetical protein COA43_11070 [Robiginitomaculum sp.]|nr:MAG: hypothetical protein COA43_11070 [Robiginitomaculum sp.]
MTKIFVDVEQTHFFLTPSGDILFANDELDAYDSERAFGVNSLMPKQTLSELIEGLVQSIKTGHDETDIPRLSNFANSLRANLKNLDTLLADLPT